MSCFRGRGRVLTLIKNISLVLRLSLCNFRDFIYAQSACNTPKRKAKLEIASYDPFKNWFCGPGSHFLGENPKRFL